MYDKWTWVVVAGIMTVVSMIDAIWRQFSEKIYSEPSIFHSPIALFNEAYGSAIYAIGGCIILYFVLTKYLFN